MSWRVAVQTVLSEVWPNRFRPVGATAWKQEMMAGLIGAILVLPQGITYAYLAGMHPEQGLYCAVFVTLFCSVFGSTAMMSGPNTAVAILLGTAVLPLAGRGSPVFIDYVFLLTLMVGCIQLCVWLLRGAYVFQFISPTAIAGISAGAGFLIMMASLDNMLGLASFDTTFFFEKIYVLISDGGDLVNPFAFSIGVTTSAACFIAKRIFPRFYIIVGMGVGSALGLLIAFIWPQPVTELDYLGRMPVTLLPLHLPTVNAEYLMSSVGLLPAAFAIAFIGLAQSMVIVKELKIHAEQKVSLHKEVFAQGLANCLAPFFSAFAGSGSFNRTAVNQKLGAKTPYSGIFAAMISLAMVLFLGPVLMYTPMAVLAGVLFVVGVGMISWRDIQHYRKIKTEFAIYLATFLTVIFLGLTQATLVAALLSVVVFLLDITRLGLQQQDTDAAQIIAIRGALFFASLDQLTSRLVHEPGHHVVLDLQQTSYIDQAALDFMLHEAARLQRINARLYVRLPRGCRESVVEQLTQADNVFVVDGFPFEFRCLPE